MVVVTIKESLSAIFVLGENAQVPGGRDAHLYGGEDVMDIGLGMKPELTGKGLGKVFFQAGIVFAIKAFRPKTFRLSVATFNTRAITLYKKNRFSTRSYFFEPREENLCLWNMKDRQYETDGLSYFIIPNAQLCALNGLKQRQRFRQRYHQGMYAPFQLIYHLSILKYQVLIYRYIQSL